MSHPSSRWSFLAGVLGLAFIVQLPVGAGTTTDAPTDQEQPTAAGPYRLTIAPAPTGGKVRSAGVNCGLGATACQVTMPAPMELGVEAEPAQGYSFAGWSGDCAGSTRSLQLRLSGPRTCSATFTPIAGTPLGPVVGMAYGLTIAPVPTGGKVLSAGVNCGLGATACRVTMPAPVGLGVEAVPANGYVFSGWAGDCAGTNPGLYLRLDGVRTCTALFSALTAQHEPPSTGSPAGTTPTGSGSPSTTPASGGGFRLTISPVPTGGRVLSAGVNCGAGATSCQVNMPAAMGLGLEAVPASGYTFAGWTGDCTGAKHGFFLQLNGPRTCGATFTFTAKTTPAITWATPASIVPGTALSGTQLNAAASVPGTFVYAPAAGTVLAAGTHTLSVTFTPADATRYTSASKAVTLSVTTATKLIPTLTWATPTPIAPGTALSGYQLNAKASVNGLIVYTPPAGTVLEPGTHTLSATLTPSNTLYARVSATTTLVVTPRLTPTLTWPTPAPIMVGTPLGPTQLNATASVAGSLTYTPAAGTVLPAGPQALSVTFTPTNRLLYTPVTAAVPLVVKMPAVVTWTAPAPIDEGTELGQAQLNATANVPGTFAYSPRAGTVPTGGAQTLTVVFTPADPTRYSTAAASTTLVVRRRPTLTWATPAPVAVGAALSAAQLNAVASVAGTLSYAPAAGTVLPAGSHTVTVTFTPATPALYTSATASVTVGVGTKSTPTIRWTPPAAIPPGTALSAAQLNATASVAGTFGYSPAAGTVPAPGSHTLSVTFTPTNTAAYATVTTAVPLTVEALTLPAGAFPIVLERIADDVTTVSFGLPLKPGAVVTPAAIGVYLGLTRVNAEVKPLLYHHDAAGDPTSLRAVLIQFPASLLTGVRTTVGLTLTDSGPVPSGAIEPFTAVSIESPETVLVADRTIVPDGAAYRFQEANPRTVTLFTSREPAVQAHFPDGYLAETGLLGPQVSATAVRTNPNLAGLAFLSDALLPYVRSAGYDDAYAYNPAADSVVDPVSVYEGWLYDRCATMLTAWVHTGDPTTRRDAMRVCAYYSAKISLSGASRGIFTGKDGADTKYSHLRGLYAYYALTGDEGALAAGQAIADLWLHDPYFVGPYRAGSIRTNTGLWTERLLGTSLEGLYYGFRLQGDRTYLTAFQEMLTTAYRHLTTTDQAELVAITKNTTTPPFPPQNCWIHNAYQAAEGLQGEPWCSTWMSELVIDSLLAYQAQTHDPRVDEIFIRLARFLRDVGSHYMEAKSYDDTFLAPSTCFNPGMGEQTRHLVPLYGAALLADGSRVWTAAGDPEHCTDATALTAAALRGLVRQGKFDDGGPIGPFPSEGAALLQLHHEFAYCSQMTFTYWARTYRNPNATYWTSARLAAGAASPAAFIAANKIGYPAYQSSPQRKISWWFNMAMLQFQLLDDAGLPIPHLHPGAVQPAGQACPVR